MKNLLSILTLLFVIAFTLSAKTSAAEDKFITIGTGSVKGVYYPAGGSICRLVNKDRKNHGIRCSVESTGGSIDNLNMLRSKELDIAITQSDWQFQAYNGSDHFKDKTPMKNLRALFSLHSEPFTVIARKDAGIKTFDDLKGKRVNIGNEGSGMRATMDVIMKYKKWDYKVFKEVFEHDVVEQVKELCDGKIDAMVYSAGHPNGAVQEVTSTCDAIMVPVTGKDIDRMIKENPYYAYTSIPGGMYYGNDKDIKTIGVKATFVTLDTLPNNVAYQVVKAVFDNFENFRTLHPVFSNLEPQHLVHEGNTAPLHPGAAKYFKEKGLL